MTFDFPFGELAFGEEQGAQGSSSEPQYAVAQIEINVVAAKQRATAVIEQRIKGPQLAVAQIEINVVHPRQYAKAVIEQRIKGPQLAVAVIEQQIIDAPTHRWGL
ncbi:MAG: hypothetical protein ABW066_06785, partial [Sedimenticola sp.]